MAAFPIRAQVPVWLGWFAILSAISWLLAAAYYATGNGVLDATGSALGKDFVNYFTAGHLAAEGRTGEIFDHARFLAAERALVHPDLPFYFWSYPPPALLLVWPLGLFGYVPGLIVWLLANLAALAAALRVLFADTASRWLIALSPAFAVNAIMGQNGGFSAALLLGGLALLDRRPVIAGALFGLLVFKPQIGILLPVVVIATGNWRALIAAGVTAFAAIALSALAFGPDAWRDFIQLTVPTQVSFIGEGSGPFLWMMPSAFASARLLFGMEREALIVQAPFLVFATIMAWRVCRAGYPVRERAAAVALATFVATPQLFMYDLIPSAVAALIAMERGDRAVWPWLVWILPMACVPLALLNVPISPLILAWALWSFSRRTERGL